MSTDLPLLRLADGVRVVRRGRDRLQVGLDPERRVVLPRDAATTALLERLGGGGATPADPATQRLVEQLDRRHLVAPADPPAPARVVVRRAGARGPWPVDPEALLGSSGRLTLQLVRSAPDAVLVLALGEPDRDDLDPLVRDGVPHLVVTLRDGGARLGPLVVPGRTACLRCIDTHHAATDPEHLAVLVRYTDATGSGGLTEPGPGEPALAALATAWALRDLDHVRSGGPGPAAPATPATWSSTLTWHPGSPEPLVRRWLRHPGCGCTWASTPWDS